MDVVGRLPQAEVFTIFRQAAEALAAAQRAGLIHRDVKPGNILFSEDGRVKIVDFGLATVDHHEGGREADGELWGTPFYVAPEMLAGHAVDFRADIYALGAAMWHAFTGEPPCPAHTTSIEELLEMKRKPLDLRRVLPGVRPEVAGLFNRCVAFNPDDRYASYEELLRDIRGVRRGQNRGKRMKRIFLWGMGAVGFVIACGAFARFAGGRRVESPRGREEMVTVEGKVHEPSDRERMQRAWDLFLNREVEQGGKILRLVFRSQGAGAALKVWAGVSLAAVSWTQDHWLEAQEVLGELEQALVGDDLAMLPWVHAVRAAALGAENAQSDLPPDFEMVRQVFVALRAYVSGNTARAVSAIALAEDLAGRSALAESEGIRRLVLELGRELRAESAPISDGAVKRLLLLKPRGGESREGR
jgi:hypothetical protein